MLVENILVELFPTRKSKKQKGQPRSFRQGGSHAKKLAIGSCPDGRNSQTRPVVSERPQASAGAGVRAKGGKLELVGAGAKVTGGHRLATRLLLKKKNGRVFEQPLGKGKLGAANHEHWGEVVPNHQSQNRVAWT